MLNNITMIVSSLSGPLGFVRMRAVGRPPVRALAGAAALLALAAGPLQAQYVPFGKNKVQYTDFEWHILSGPRVDVYYYPEEEELARSALAYAEESFDSLVVLFQHRPFRRVPLFIYSSHQHFEQTNLTPGFLPEGVAGFTEFLKRRIALPFNGSYTDFQHTIRHELVHFFQLSKLTRVFDQYPRFSGPGIPLWWSEGLAERWSSEQDSDDEMFIRDMVLSGRLPSLMSITYDRSFLAYPLGGQIHEYLGERFGYGRVAEFYDDVWKYSSFEDAVAGVYGISLEELDRQWRFELEREYFPLYEHRSPVNVDARALIAEDLPNFKPSVHDGPQGPEVFFMSPRTGYTTIYRMPLGGGDSSIRPVVEGDKSEEFESLHFFSSRLDVSSGNKLVFVSKYLEKDAIQVYDLERERVVGRYQFDELVALSSPAWSPDGKKVVFSGLSVAGPSNLYILDFETQEHHPITDDRFLESDPDWSPDGRYIVYSSDATSWGADGGTNLFLHEVETGATRYLTYGPWKDSDPRFAPHGERIVFTSDRTGVHDLYIADLDGEGGRLTNYTGDIFDADWLPDGSGMVFSAYEDGTFNLYLKELAPRGQPATDLALVDRFGPPGPGLAMGWGWKELGSETVAEVQSRPYRTKYGLDFAAGQAAFAPGFGSAQGAQFLASDMLGDHLIFFSVVTQNFGDLNDIFDSFAGQIMYLNLSRRVNWGVGAFRFNGRFVDAAFSDIYQEKTFGGFFVASYPFSKFRRLELQTTLEYSDRLDTEEFFLVEPVTDVDDISLTRKGLISTNSLSYVKDNTLWLNTGPIAGTRYNFSVGVVTDLTHARAENYTLLADIRRYFRTSLLSAYAVRLFGYYSDGAIPARIAMGGPYTLRLYPFLGFIGSRAWLVSQEWRFPLMHGLALAFPFGTIRFPGVQGALFVDMGGIWQETRKLRGTWGSYGVSFRMPILFPIVLRLDVGKRFTIGNLPTFRLEDFHGTEVDFFIGFNY
ncbi:MAG: hypothetical protein GWN99_04625 [Gemmatimonadetes bacterium]|uniref:Peptidase MA-like domain-containing protein n=1 Tax=Candidatus Kutchimonas denitrificans TaxID=3056748 RepID=A0AAE5CCJ8_9BACT|nr:hypothetical protein [Gemmatimonadota bacterium]NIR75735.1 hypothetical protein [Candidatus Kutchimonas denitrificans]NIS00348.1 hypothetical protein [Gemmatimonadota bacterium]NIT66007.1 hypothetical protein [Gemmatimonadota bacterium]NIU53711.1 hypothetical protein [Gemmatimonadota bacterium]